MRFSPKIKRLAWLIERPVAHRGLHDPGNGVLENTASAFEAAIANGYGIECDLQLTRDGEAVMFHDRTLDRVTQGTGRVDHHTVADLKAIPYKESPDRIQTLAEMLQQVNGRVPLVIEIKSRWNRDERLTRRTLAVLKGYKGHFALMSFDPHVIAVVRREAPRFVRGIVADRTNDEEYRELTIAQRLEMQNFTHLPRTRPHFISFYWRELPWAPVMRFRQAGNPVLSWTIRSPEVATMARRYTDQITFERFRP